MGKKEAKKKVKRALRCPVCLSDRKDLYLGGKFSLQMYKCLDCGYIGAGFMEVEEGWSPNRGQNR